MQFTKMAIAIATFFAATGTAMAGNVTGSSNIAFLAFDGQKVKKHSVIQISDNQVHQVVVEVSSIYKSGSDSSFFESRPIILTFTGSREDIQILSPRLNSLYDVERFSADPVFQIQTTSGKSIAYKKDYLKGEGFMPNSNIEQNLALYNASDAVASVKNFGLNSMNRVKTTTGKVVVQGDNIAEQQLQYWFQQADKQTQKRFLDWATKQ